MSPRKRWSSFTNRWLRESADGGNLFWQGCKAFGGYVIAKKIDVWHTKDALGIVDNKAIGFKAVEEPYQVFDMLLFCLTGDEDVVEVDEDAWYIMEDAVHQPLEVLGGIFEPKGHAREFKEPKGGDHHHLLDVLRQHWHLVVPLRQVNLAKDCLARQLGIEVSDMFDGVMVISSDGIEAAIITAHPEATARLVNNVERRGPGAVALPHGSKVLQLSKLPLSHGELLWQKMASSGEDWRSYHRDVVKNSAVWCFSVESKLHQLWLLI